MLRGLKPASALAGVDPANADVTYDRYCIVAVPGQFGNGDSWPNPVVPGVSGRVFR